MSAPDSHAASDEEEDWYGHTEDTAELERLLSMREHRLRRFLDGWFYALAFWKWSK